jgi:hypothetical protein
MILIPCAVVLFGVTLLFGSGVTARLNAIEISKSPENELKPILNNSGRADGHSRIFGVRAVMSGPRKGEHIARVAVGLNGQDEAGAGTPRGLLRPPVLRHIVGRGQAKADRYSVARAVMAVRRCFC